MKLLFDVAQGSPSCPVGEYISRHPSKVNSTLLPMIPLENAAWARARVGETAAQSLGTARR